MGVTHAIQPSWVCKGLVTVLSPKASREAEQPGERDWLVPGAATADTADPGAGPAGQTACLGAGGEQREALRAGLSPLALGSTAGSGGPGRLGLNKHAGQLHAGHGRPRFSRALQHPANCRAVKQRAGPHHTAASGTALQPWL